MEFLVRKVNLSNHAIETPSQGIYKTYPCPICQDDEYVRLVGCVEANGKSSLESAFCGRCEHRFHRKFPSLEWLRQYYAEKYEGGRGESLDAHRQPIERPGFCRRVRSQIGSLIRYGLVGEKPNRVHDFCSGLTKGDNVYYCINPEIKKIFEIGCGNGDNLKYFSDAGYETWGTESNPGRVITCRKRGLNVYLTGEELPGQIWGASPFDFIYSSHVLEHIIDIDGHISELTRLIRPGGFLYVETPDLSGESVIYQTHTIFHVHTFSLPSMLKLLRKHGFAPVRVQVDSNLQVLTQKRADSNNVDVELGGNLYSDSSEAYLKCLLEHAPDRFCIHWDHYRVKIVQLSNGTVIYERGLRALRVARGPNQHHLVCEVPRQTLTSVYPVRFKYESEDPPIWYKN